MKKRILHLITLVLSLTMLYSLAVNANETPGWHYKDGIFTYSINDSGKITEFKKTGILQFKNETTYHTTNKTFTFKPGFYYFIAGQLQMSVDNKSKKLLVYKVSSTDSLTEAGQYMMAIHSVKKTSAENNTVITPETELFTGSKAQIIYQKGLPHNGLAKKKGVFYRVKDGVLGDKYKGFLKVTYVDTEKNKICQPNFKLYKDGVGYNGVYNKIYYKNGKQSTWTGWLKINKNLYYFKKGAAITGTKYLPSYGGGNKKYRYTFNKNGVLLTNLFLQGDKKIDYYKVPMKIEVNITTHTTTLLMYDSKTKSYDIPLKAFVCSTARNGKGTKTGNHVLAKGSRCRWFVPKKGSHHYYQWGVFIKGSYSWFHSEYYRAKNIYKLSVKIYNGLGTNQTSACIRLQAINARLIYLIAAKNPNRIPVQVFRSSDKGAFGQVVLADTTGKLPANATYDPTDPLIKNK